MIASSVFAPLLAGLLLVLGDLVQAGNKLPSYIQTCHRNDPNSNECIVNSIESLRPTLIKGIPELEVPPLDPLHLGEVNIKISGTTSFVAIGRDVVVHGAGGFNITHLDIDLMKHNFAVHLEVPWLQTDGIFEVDGKFMVLPIYGKGSIRCNATKIRGELLLKSAVEIHDGVEHLTFKSVEVDLKVGGFKVALNFDNDPILTEAANFAVSTNPDDFLIALKPVLETTIGNVLIDTANKITRMYSYEEIFPSV